MWHAVCKTVIGLLTIACISMIIVKYMCYFLRIIANMHTNTPNFVQPLYCYLFLSLACHIVQLNNSFLVQWDMTWHAVKTQWHRSIASSFYSIAHFLCSLSIPFCILLGRLNPCCDTSQVLCTWSFELYYMQCSSALLVHRLCDRDSIISQKLRQIYQRVCRHMCT